MYVQKKYSFFYFIFFEISVSKKLKRINHTSLLFLLLGWLLSSLVSFSLTVSLNVPFFFNFTFFCMFQYFF
jgi:hypothetical protein